MLGSFLFIVYIIFFAVICFLAFTKTGQNFQYEFFAWRTTKHFYDMKEI